MEPISNADRLVLLLRQKLEERAKAERARSGARGPAGQTQVRISGVRALAAAGSSDEKPLRRAVIQHLLADQMGGELINDAKFQEIVSRVSDAIEADDETRGLLSGVVSELRGSRKP